MPKATSVRYAGQQVLGAVNTVKDAQEKLRKLNEDLALIEQFKSAVGGIPNIQEQSLGATAPMAMPNVVGPNIQVPEMPMTLNRDTGQKDWSKALSQPGFQDPRMFEMLAKQMQLQKTAQDLGKPELKSFSSEDDIYKNGKLWRQGTQQQKPSTSPLKEADLVAGADGFYYKGTFNSMTGKTDYAKTELRVPEKQSSGGFGSSATDPEDAKAIAEAIIRGEQPPDFKYTYRMGGKIRAELAKRGFDLTSANKDWTAIQRHISTLNGPQQERLRQAITFTYDSIDIIEGLYKDLEKTGLPTGYKFWNRAALEAAKQLKGKSGEVAQLLEAQINDLTSEMATVYKGGNSSTDESLRLAAENLKSNWNPNTFKSALGLLRKNLQLRKNSVFNSSPQGLSPNSPYSDQTKPNNMVDDKTVGQVYEDASGNKAKYLGDGKWEEVK